ncbi:unnamed protein product [Ectocarpus sp. CCAP 1310/34]|nr:unnamed protein product [Ectocarpus sp. CCAP 1310/34]
MGCSSSRIPAQSQDQVEPVPSGLPTPATTAAGAGGVPPKPAPTESSGLDDLEQTRPDIKTVLILKKNQSSMEGRQNQGQRDYMQLQTRVD